jgi:uncharacterized protein YecE (DUF72 family)
MDFGKVDNPDAVDFTLPPDHPATTKLLAAHKKKKLHPEVYIGCAKWGRKEWVGMIYPKGTKDADFLKYYVQNFNSIELNATFYQTYPRPITSKWAKLAGDNFKFDPKFPQIITHMKRLKNVESETKDFLRSLEGFDDKLGHCFIQFDDRFGPVNAPLLADYLGTLPPDLKLCVELRHKSWFEESVLVEDSFEILRERKVGTVITDASGRRDVLHMRLTTPVAFIRFVSNNMHPTDYPRMDEWVDRMKHWMDSGIERIYFFMHCHDERNSPILTKYVIDKLNEVAGTKLLPPNIMDGNQSLF